MKTLVTTLTIILLAGVSAADDKARSIDAENGFMWKSGREIKGS